METNRRKEGRQKGRSEGTGVGKGGRPEREQRRKGGKAQKPQTQEERWQGIKLGRVRDKPNQEPEEGRVEEQTSREQRPRHGTEERKGGEKKGESEGKKRREHVAKQAGGKDCKGDASRGGTEGEGRKTEEETVMATPIEEVREVEYQRCPQSTRSQREQRKPAREPRRGKRQKRHQDRRGSGGGERGDTRPVERQMGGTRRAKREEKRNLKKRDSGQRKTRGGPDLLTGWTNERR
ncbi:hypothetical protein AMTRI_Chr01g131650 [Amborella trichopoda]